MTTSLLDELRKYSTIDLDCNDEAVALKHRPFQDMTSNQLIVLGQLKQQTHAAILPAACRLAKQYMNHFPNIALEDLTVDVATVLLGKAVAQHLQPAGYVHAQTLPSLAHDTDGTIKHALRLVKLYDLNGVFQDRVCIKIPSTPEGIAACARLESQQDVRTLATTCFAFAQGLAAARAKCTYVAPYVNPLYVHIEPSKHVPYKDPLASLTGLQVTFALQQAFKKMDANTKVLAASLVTAEECFALCGIEHITLSANALALLQQTALDMRFEGIRDRSLAYLDSEHKRPSNGFWTSSLEDALNDTQVSALQDDALTHFGQAETDLREMAQQELQR